MGGNTGTGGRKAARIKVSPLGEGALLFAWPEAGNTEHAEIAAVAAHIRRLALPWIKELVPAYRTLAVHIDWHKFTETGSLDGLSERSRLAESLLLAEVDRAQADDLQEPARQVRLPAKFGGKEGPDLAECAERSGLSEEAFVERYCSMVYEVAMIGFAPGFPYLSGLPELLAQPRRSSPRLQVPAGSVGIAGGQTGVYSVQSPGGWQLIGRTFVPVFRPAAEEPFLLGPGDRVSFVPVDCASECEQEELRHDRLSGFEKVGHSGTTESVLVVEKRGLLTTIQDGGRPGWQAYGVSVGGAMDPISMRTANSLVGNSEDAAVLEMTMIGAGFRVERDTLAAICGADMEARVDGSLLPMDRPVWLRAGTALTFGRARRGCRTYLAVAGGFETPVVLGSRSTDARAGIGGIEGRALAAGDRLYAGDRSTEAERWAQVLHRRAEKDGIPWASVSWSSESFVTAAGLGIMTLRVIAGSEWQEFSMEAHRTMLGEIYRVEASSDRMGLRLTGPALQRDRGTELSSHGVVPGTVQVPPNGQPIVLAAGCQPTGGYPKIAHIIRADLPLLAQCRPGDELRFRLVDLSQAWEIREQLERDFAVLQAGIRLALMDPEGAWMR